MQRRPPNLPDGDPARPGSAGLPQQSLGDLETKLGGTQRTTAHVDGGGTHSPESDADVVDLAARYEIVGTLGRGGMGEVLKAVDRRLRRSVAIKRIRAELAGDPLAMNRFLTEARAIAALSHFNIVQIYDYGWSVDGPFLVMEFVDGESLADRIQRGALPPPKAIELGCQLCDALSAAHALGIIHRDIKPANVLLTSTGAPKLSDFGLARRQGGDRSHTQAGAILGTADFMSPEQQANASRADPRSDLWSLAATLYQTITGKTPKVIRLSQLPAGLQSVFEKALEEDPARRFQTADEFRRALRGTRIPGPNEAIRPATTSRTGDIRTGDIRTTAVDWAACHWWILAAAACAAILMMGGLIITFVHACGWS